MSDRAEDNPESGLQRGGESPTYQRLIHGRSSPQPDVVYKLRDINKNMVAAMEEHFRGCEHVQVSKGDIFQGAPSADAIVSPANSFGFMDGGIDMELSLHFGWQMQGRLQEKIRKEFDGELLVGQATIISTMENPRDIPERWSDSCNEGQPIRYLVSAPTMRTPEEVDQTVNAYLAFRAILLAVRKYNSDPDNTKITSVLCPGLGTAVGRMPARKCAFQMRKAYDRVELGQDSHLTSPKDLGTVWEDHSNMKKYGDTKKK